MEITPEEKERIADVEMEQYRAALRAKQNEQFAPPGTTPSAITAEKSSVVWMWLAWTMFALVGIGVVIFDVAMSRAGSKAVPPRYVAVNREIASGQTLLKVHGYIYYKIEIVPDMKEAVVAGTFKVAGSFDNKIEAIIAGEGDYINWINDRESELDWETPSPTDAGTIDVHLGPGTYYLVFSNTFSPRYEKYVALKISLNYKRWERSVPKTPSDQISK
jgi:hypothetical protein